MKDLSIDIPGNVHFLVLTLIAKPFLSSGVCEILETFKGIVILYESSF
jgi:hypothetical protein